tara:strand:+ start:11730 stop:12662 length:933 start_codon:yes stop_codon:yes gene_type:complete
LNKNKIILISFFTEGEPYDIGKNLTIQKNIFFEKNKNLFDDVILYSPRGLIKKNKNWESILFNKKLYSLDKNSEQRIVDTYEGKGSINKNWIKLNSLLWKPAIIMETLNNKDIPNDSIIIYHDIDTTKYPFYLKNFDNLKKNFFEELKNNSIALCRDSFSKLSVDCKQELIRSYLGSHGNTLFHVWAGCIGLKKNKSSIDFCKYWLDITNIDKNRNQLTKFSSYPHFLWHSQEQATLSVAYYKWKYNFSRSNEITYFFTINPRKISPAWNFKKRVIYITRFCFFVLKNNIFKFFYERILIIFLSNFRNLK